MKKVIRSATKSVKASYDLDYFSDIQSKAYRAGYDLKADETGDITLSVIDEDYKLPEIEVRKIEGERTIYEAHMEFPALDTADEQYYDSIEFYVKHWLKAAEFVVYLQQWSPDDYVDEE